MASGLRFGPLGPNVLHLCIDMQTLFAERTDWHVPWPAASRARPCIEELGNQPPDKSRSARAVELARMATRCPR